MTIDLQDANKTQKFVIEHDGAISIEWINPVFSDTIIELLPQKEQDTIKQLHVDMRIEPKIYCG
jgi:hypothetical protein